MRYWMPVLALGLIACFFTAASAQINGVPPSVTSFGFGGQPGFQGVSPSVTSLGPKGFNPPHPSPHQPQFHPQHGMHQPGSHHHHHEAQSYPYYIPYYVPYYPMAEPYEPPAEDDAVADAQYEPEQDRGGPTIFDRRGSGARSEYYENDRMNAGAVRPPAPAAAAESNTPAVKSVPETPKAPEASIAAEPSTVLVFKDGHKQEVTNYAIVGANLFDLTPGHRLKIALADLNLEATQKANDDQGIDFKLPQMPTGN
jgi:hypothetical protein